jgi:sulfur carrier protein
MPYSAATGGAGRVVLASHAVHILVNGDSREVPAGTTVAALLGMLGVDRTQVAVERNRDVVPKKSYEQTTLADGDRLEVVTFVGGG